MLSAFSISLPLPTSSEYVGAFMPPIFGAFMPPI
jgi:hypothetical protein